MQFFTFGEIIIETNNYIIFTKSDKNSQKSIKNISP